jgi:hypothetical protein
MPSLRPPGNRGHKQLVLAHNENRLVRTGGPPIVDAPRPIRCKGARDDRRARRRPASRDRRRDHEPASEGADGGRQSDDIDDDRLAGRVLGGRADPPLLRVHPRPLRRHRGQPRRRPRGGRRALRPARRVQVGGRRPDLDGFLEHRQAGRAARRHGRSSPSSTSTISTRSSSAGGWHRCSSSATTRT